MAKSKNNVVTHGLSGTIGDMLIFRQKGGKTIVATKSEKPRKLPEIQKEQMRRFQHAALYAKAAQVSEEYKSAATKEKTAYIIAVADFLKAPSIEQVDLSAYTGQPGNTIRIRVIDDFAVKTVIVRITNGDGSLVEEGEAHPDAINFEWIYTATASNSSLDGDKIEIFASDTPGNVTQEEYML